MKKAAYIIIATAICLPIIIEEIMFFKVSIFWICMTALLFIVPLRKMFGKKVSHMKFFSKSAIAQSSNNPRKKVQVGGRAGCHALLPLLCCGIDDAILHHKTDVLKVRNVVQWISRHRHDVSELARF